MSFAKFKIGKYPTAASARKEAYLPALQSTGKDTVSHILPCPDSLPPPDGSNKAIFIPARHLSSPPAMSLVVEQPRDLRVNRPASESHAAPSPLNIDRVPNMPSKPDDFYPTSATHSNRSSYDSMQNYSYNHTMDDQAIISTKPARHEVEDQAPVLPQKSALRTSRLLDTLAALKMPDPAVAPAFTENPHDEYLSSEEEASSTAGDFSDFEYDSSSDEVSPVPTKECSTCEVTARVVSVVFSGKPSVVDVPQSRRSISPSSTELHRSMLDIGHKPTLDAEVKRRRLSTSTISSTRSSASKTNVVHPPRTSSMLPPAPMQAKPAFLRIDPYANRSTYSLSSQERPVSRQTIEEERPKTPKTPTKMFKGVARAMSLMKRRSVPKLNQAYLAPSNENLSLPKSPSNGSIPEEPADDVSQEKMETQDEVTDMPSLPPRPSSRPQLKSRASEDVLRTSRTNEKIDRHLSIARTFHGDLDSPVSPVSPMSATSTHTNVSNASNGKRMSSLNVARRRMSIKLTGKLQL